MIANRIRKFTSLMLHIYVLHQIIIIVNNFISKSMLECKLGALGGDIIFPKRHFTESLFAETSCYRIVLSPKKNITWCFQWNESVKWRFKKMMWF